MYPEFLDNPAVTQALADALADSNKTWELENELYNPEIEFYYKISVGGRLIGVTTSASIRGAGGPTPLRTTTRPVVNDGG